MNDEKEEFETTFTFRLAIQLLQHFGVVAAQDAGTTDAGHPILRLQEPYEVVTRAFTIAEMAVHEGIKRNLIWKKDVN